jgi:hypothetical protein
MNNIIFYNSYDIFCNSDNKEQLNLIPGGQKFSSLFSVFSKNISIIDRSHTVKIPLKCDILPWLVMPKYEKFNTTFSDIMDARALQIFRQATDSNRKLAVMYSGGIDSTAILVSLLKNIPLQEIKEHVVVLLSELSIMENPNFYRDHVIKNFGCVSSSRFPYLIGNDDYLMVSGENADQLFGSQVTSFFSRGRDFTEIFKPIDQMKGEIIDWMASRIEADGANASDAGELFHLLEKIVASAPIELDDVHKFFWWINFTTKWQSVYVRMLGFSQNIKKIKLEENYTTFYHPKEFQLWSMNNTDKFIKDTSSSSKYIVKEYIFNFNKDLDYFRNKSKIGSLSALFKHKNLPIYITKNMEGYHSLPGINNFNLENDFK